MRPLIPWVGGKRKLAEEIVKRMPKHTCYCEPFFGGGAVLFAKERSGCEVVNDINEELVNLYECVRDQPWRLLAELEWTLVSRARFEALVKADTSRMPKARRAARFYYLVKTAFAAKATPDATFGASRSGQPRFNPFTVAGDVAAAYHRLARVFIERLPFERFILKYDTAATFFYVDPPYVCAPGCYEFEFTEADHRRLAEALRQVRGKWLLSYNDCPLVRELYDGFKIETVKTTYSIGLADRGREIGEVFIRNY